MLKAFASLLENRITLTLHKLTQLPKHEYFWIPYDVSEILPTTAAVLFNKSSIDEKDAS